MLTGYDLVKSTVYLHDKAAFTYTDTPTSRDFLLLAERRLEELDKYLADNGTDPVEITKKLFIARQSLSVGSDMLDTQKLFFSWDGFNWKTLQTVQPAVAGQPDRPAAGQTANYEHGHPGPFGRRHHVSEP